LIKLDLLAIALMELVMASPSERSMVKEEVISMGNSASASLAQKG
jgi:hypothetical protein